MAGLEDMLRSSAPGGNIGKPLMLALLALLASGALVGRGGATSPASAPAQPKADEGGGGLLGGLGGLLDKLPSQLSGRAGQQGPAELDRAERDVRRMEGIICSMTPLERRKPELLKATRKRRIASGAGVQVQDVNRLLNQFEQMRDVMKKMKGGGMMKMMKRMGGLKGMGGVR